MGQYIHPKPQRNKQIFKLRKLGQTLERIGRRYNITKERVRQILKQEAKKVINKSRLDKITKVC